MYNLFYKVATSEIYKHNRYTPADVEEKCLEAMDTYAGSFVKQLAVLYRLADPVNKGKLIETFSTYFIEYIEMAIGNTAKKIGGEEA